MPWHERIATVYLAVVAVLLAVLLLAFGIPALWYGGRPLFQAATAGRITEIDGVRQNGRVYIEDACYDPKENEIAYTVVNKSGKKVNTHVRNMWVEKRTEEGTWALFVDMERVFADNERNFEVARFVLPFKSATYRMDADDLWSEILPGEYRILLGGSYARRFNEADEEEWYLRYPEDGFCVVGYFTITEEMLSQ